MHPAPRLCDALFATTTNASKAKKSRMHIQTILNQRQKYTSFRYGKCRMVRGEDGDAIEVEIVPRKNSRPECSQCGRKGPVYDHQPTPRHFDFVPLWGIAVIFVYVMRRVNCPTCGVKVERVPWAQGKSPTTTTFAWFLAHWAKLLSWSDTARAFKTSWSTVFNAVEMAVEWGRQHMNLDGVSAIGVDEISWQRRHRYLTVVYQIDQGMRRLLWVGEHRKAKTLLKFFRWFGKEKTAALRFIASDMWKPYLKVIAYKAKNAIHILDRFHIMSMMNKAIDEVRASEARKLAAESREPVLKKSRWLLLKNPVKLSTWQGAKLRELLKYNLQSVRAYLLKEDFQQLWLYSVADHAAAFLKSWCRKTMLSKIEPMKKVARTIRVHQPLIMNWFEARGEISQAAVEGMNNKSKLTIRKAYGFRSFRASEIALYHTLGKLPEPDFTHTFW